MEMEIELDNIIIICQKCYEKGVYLIPLITINKSNNIINYKCSKCDMQDKNLFFEIVINNKIKKRLNECTIHKNNNNFCGWCKKCKKNICPNCIEEEIKKGHDYISIKFIIEKNEFQKKLEDMKYILKKIEDKSSKETFEIKDELIKYIKLFEYFYKLYYEENINNYQIIENINNVLKYYNNIKLLIKEKYNDFISFIKGKNIHDIDKTVIDDYKNMYRLNMDFKKLKIIPIIDENNIKRIIIYDILKHTFTIYEFNGNWTKFTSTYNEYNDKFGYDIDKIIQYNPPIFIILSGYNIIFIKFFKKYKYYEIINEINLKKEREYNGIRFFSKQILSFKYENKIIKIKDNLLLILFYGKLYRIFFDDTSFLKEKYNQKYEISRVENNSLFLDMIPIYNTDKNRKIKEIICIRFKAYFNNENNIISLNMINYLLSRDCRLINNKPYFEVGGFGENKYIIYLLANHSYLNRNYRITEFINIPNKCRNEKLNISIEINRFNNDLIKYDYFHINLSEEEIIKAFIYVNYNTFFSIKYIYHNNFILLFINNKIYQIHLKYHEIITIYELGIKGYNLKLNTIHYFNEDLSKIEELILARDSNINDIYPYYFENNTLKPIKFFELPKFIDLIEFNFFELKNKNSLNLERILVDQDNILLFK